MTTNEMLAAEKEGFNLFKLIDILQYTINQKREIARIDITSGEEHYRKKEKLLKHIHKEKEYDSTFGMWYVLSEIARDESLSYYLSEAKPKNNISKFIFDACKQLSDERVFTSSILYLIVTMCTKLDADAILHSYDVDRIRGKKRAIEWIKNYM